MTSVSILACAAALTSQFAVPPARAEENSVKIAFVGDVMLDGGPGHIITNGGDPFAGVAAVLRDADLTIANLECAIVKKGKAEDKPYTFRAPQSALPVLKRYFSAVSLANNHSGDWGKAGFASEIELLRETKLPYFGGGSNARAARQPLVLAAGGKRVAFLGYNDFPPARSRLAQAHPARPGSSKRTWSARSGPRASKRTS